MFPFFKSPREAIKAQRVGLDNSSLQINCIGPSFESIPLLIGLGNRLCPIQQQRGKVVRRSQEEILAYF